MKHSDLLRDNRFLVYINASKYSFEKVGGIEKSYPREIYNEGGEDIPHVFKGKISELHTLRLEHGIQVNASGGMLSNKMKPGTIFKNIQIIALGKDMKPNKEFFFPEAVLTRVEIGQFDASGEGILIESFELEYYDLVQNLLI